MPEWMIPGYTVWTELQAVADAAAAVPARIRLGEIAPDMVRREAEVKQITRAIRIAAYNFHVEVSYQ